MTPIIIPVILDSCNVRKDKSAGIRFTTCGELTAVQNAEFFQNNGMAGILYFRASDEQPDVEKLDSVEVDLYSKGKTPSKRLRDVIYLYVKQELGRKPTEEEWKERYRTTMEKIINQLKDKLE